MTTNPKDALTAEEHQMTHTQAPISALDKEPFIDYILDVFEKYTGPLIFNIPTALSEIIDARDEQIRTLAREQAIEECANIVFDMGSALNLNYDIGTIIAFREKICALKTQNLPPELQPNNNPPTSVMGEKLSAEWFADELNDVIHNAEGYSFTDEMIRMIEQRDRAIENAAYERAAERFDKLIPFHADWKAAADLIRNLKTPSSEAQDDTN